MFGKRRVQTFGFVAIAGALGALFRYGIEFIGISGHGSTLLANVIGCLLLGVFIVIVGPENRRIRAIIGGGFIGSMTTYSGLATAVVATSPVRGALYLGVTYAAGLLAIWLGSELAGRGGYRWS